jgi:CheY-like chemotaxis protein
LTTPRVLIAEDDDVIRMLLRRIAERSGCVTVTAADGAEALDQLQRGGFDLVILDLMMPLLNGYDLIPHIRAIRPRPAVLVVTAMMGDGFLELDSDVVTAIIHKPFDTEMLGSLIAQVAEALSARRRAIVVPPENRDRPEAR